MIDDPELLRQYLENSSEAAFAEIVRRHVDFVYGVALRHAGGAHRAEDVVQLVFIDLARKAGALSQRTELVGWLYTSTRYAAAKVVRAEVRRETREQEAHMSLTSHGEFRPADWRELQPMLDEALQGLGDRDRSAILLRFFKNLSFAEIGGSWRISEEAARKRVDRALEKLRARLTRRGINSTAAALADALGQQVSPSAPATLAAAATSAALLARHGAAQAPILAKLLHLMSTAKATATVAVFVGLLSLGTAYYEIRAERVTQAELAAANRGYADLQAEIRRARSSTASGGGQASHLPPVRPTASTVSTAVVNPAEGPMVGTPALAKVGVKYIREMTRRDLAPVLEKLGLGPTQIETFLDARAGYGGLMMNGVQVVPGQRPDEPGAVLNDGLTPEQEAELNRFQATEGDINFSVRLVAGNLYDSDPLPPSVASQLQEIIAANTPAAEGGARSVQRTDWAGVLAAASGILSVTQLDAVRSYAMARTGNDFTSASPGSSTTP